jgi:hypothetical protein
MAFTLSGSVITQSGTDANPEGLQAIAGVTTINKGNATTKRIVYDLGTLQLNIAGDLTLDPDVYEIIGNVANGIQVVTGADYKYGIERIVNGKKTYSKGTGMVSTFQGNFFNAFGIVLSGGTMTWNGGVIRTTGAISHSGCVVTSNSIDSVWQNVGISGQWRSTGSPDFKNITMQGINADCVLFLLSGWTNLAINFERAYYQTPASGGITRTVENALFANNQAFVDLATNQSIGNQQLTIAKNPDVVPRFGKVSNNAYADFQVVQSLNINLTDSEGLNAENVIAYLKDSDNGARKNATINGLPDGAVTNNYLLDRTYIANSDVNGVASLGDILSVVAIHNNLTDGTMNLDYRSNYGNESVDFNVYLGGYDYNSAVTRQSLIGNNGKQVDWTMFNDLNVSLSRANALAKLASSFTIDIATQTIIVTANSTYDDLYDIAKAFKYNGTQINAETPTISDLIISASGSNLVAFNGWQLVVNSGVTLSSGTKFERITFATITNNGTITGVYSDSTGTSTVLTLTGFEEGSSVYVEDNEENQIFFSDNASAPVTIYIPPTATAPWYYAIEKYGNQRQSEFFTFSGGFRTIEAKVLEDLSITEKDVNVVAAYTELNTPDRIYDYVSYKRLLPPLINYGQIVFRDGKILFIEDVSILVNKDAANVLLFDIPNKILNIRAITLQTGLTFNLIKATPPATITANSNEVISVEVIDANGDSSINIQGGSGNFSIFKFPIATTEFPAGGIDERIDPSYLITATAGNGKYRFTADALYNYVVLDNTQGNKANVPKEDIFNQEWNILSQGGYVAGLFQGEDQIQLAQVNEVYEILSKVNNILIDTDSIKGNGFIANVDSLKRISDRTTFVKDNALLSSEYTAPDNDSILEIKTKVDTLENADLTGVAQESTLQEVNDKIDNIEPTDLNEVLEGIEKASILVPFKKA